MADADEDIWLFKIGATAPAFWSAVAAMQLRRVEEGVQANKEHRDHPARDRDSVFDGFAVSLTHSFGPLEADAYFLLVAVRHMLALADRALERLGDERVRQAIARFKQDVPDAKDLRDVIAHIDRYAVGEGHIKGRGLEGQGSIQIGTDYVVRAGELSVDVVRATAAAQDLGRAIDATIPQPVRIIARHPEFRRPNT